MKGIDVNEEKLMELTSEYAKKYGTIPDTHKQAVQWAYEYGRSEGESAGMEYAIRHIIELLEKKRDHLLAACNIPAGAIAHGVQAVIDTIVKDHNN